MTERLWIPGKPVPWQRTRGNRSTEPRYGAWKEAAGWEMRSQWREAPLTEAVAISISVADSGIEVIFSESHLDRPRGVKGDLDNYVKAILDAAQGVVIQDDRQVRELGARFRR